MTPTIGFASKYYTLWEVSEPTRVASDYHTYTTVYYNYLQNLSFDLDKAKEKMEKRYGHNGYDIDLSLRGSRSFEKELSIEYNKDVLLFGKHKGSKFEEVKDDGYLEWYYTSTVNTEKFSPELESYLISIGVLFEIDDEIITRKQMDIHIKNVFTKEVYQLGHFGEEGDRITTELTVRGTWGYNTQFGWVDVIEMFDAEQNLYYVRGSYKGDVPDEGNVVNITGTISHKSWFDRNLGGERKETQLKRPVINEIFS